MDIIPVLEAGELAKPELWYALSPDGNGPCARVGHACIVLNKRHNENQNSDDIETLIINAGATPAGPFQDVYTLQMGLESFEWKTLPSEGLIARYEHAAFVCSSSKIYVFGGAEQGKNLNDVQAFNLGDETWHSIDTKGCPPCPRTCHSAAAIGNKMFIFGGGHDGAQPVTDVQMYMFDADDHSWSQLQTTGERPSPRHGHVMVNVEKHIYLHGGMEGIELFDDLYKFDTERCEWTILSTTGDGPSRRAAHAGTVTSSSIYIFGGMDKTGALDDLYRLDIDSLTWTKINTAGSSPVPRLDHTLCCVNIKVRNDTDDSDQYEERQRLKTQKLLLVFGGMDTRGEIFSDCCVLLVDSG